ncbi:MAG: histidinol-phosphate transaminase [Armatimonadota bacterium]|nr:histidinol-phosphate transaminase [Armatimonadota bacterium]MDR7440140.1 histidinol-phosphate transaminase [Armatimonadota bacterium]MDR7562930.1 histidinol-phosphate transaminase [Armatimonadota bacterium]MDR7568001.1 histidinol-phosphate transaminase [Armatimonadota bacterium]MDR7601432.1 histidinol-phosphate transaminase [Armatimonadota bacterium]
MELDPRARAALRRIPTYMAGGLSGQLRRTLGRSDLVKLASNENPLGPSPRALEALVAAGPSLGRYPDEGGWELRSALARKLRVPVEWVEVGAGSTALLRLLAEAYLDPGDSVVYPWPTFPLYAVFARMRGARETAVPLDELGRPDLGRLLEAGGNARLLILCNPNNPTGTYVPERDLRGFLERLPEGVLVVLDEAYGEFARDAAADYPDGLRWVREGRRMAVLRTFSKVYGLAGLRVGYLVAPPEVLEAVRRVREPFQVSAAAQAAALAALEDEAHVARTLAVVAAGRRSLEELGVEAGLRSYPSVANFVWFDAGLPARRVYEGLLQRGVIVRPGPEDASWIRVTVGTPQELERFREALKSVLHALRAG